MMDNGLLEKNREKACINGLIRITMMAIGKRTPLREPELPVLGESSMMDNSTSVKNMALVSRLMQMATLSKPFGNITKYSKNSKLMVKLLSKNRVKTDFYLEVLSYIKYYQINGCSSFFIPYGSKLAEE